MIKSATQIVCLVFWANMAMGQTPVHHWSFALGDTYEEDLGAVDVDGLGYSLCLGTFYDAIDLGGGTLSGPGGRDFFLTKYNPDGTHCWSQVFGGLQNDSVGDVLAKNDSTVVISGSFRGGIDFGGGVITATGTTDAFLASFTSDGVFAWCRALGGAGSQDAEGMVEDGAGNIIVVGSFFTEVDLGGGPLISQGTSDIFVAKYSSVGDYIWGHSFGSTMGESDIYVAVDENNDVVISGDFTTSLNFGGTDLVCTGASGVYLVKLSGADGAHLWSMKLDSTNGISANAVAVDELSNIVCVGEFIGPVNFGGTDLTSAGLYTDLFMVKFDLNGSHLWSQGFGTTGFEPVTDVAIDSQNNIIITGYHYLGEDLDLGGGPLGNSGGSDIFLAAFNPNGSHMCSGMYGDASMQLGASLAIGPEDEIVFAGTFEGALDFGDGPLESHGDFDIFLANMDLPVDTSGVFPLLPESTVLLQQNFPNPFNPSTTIVFYLSSSEPVNLRVYDVSGRLICAILADDLLDPGRHEVQWDGKDNYARQVPAGLYFYQLSAGGISQTKCMALVK